MYFDAFTAAAIADELSATIHNGFVQRVVLPDRYSVALEIYSQRRRRQLLLTADPSHSRVLLVSDKPTARRGLQLRSASCCGNTCLTARSRLSSSRGRTSYNVEYIEISRD
ncbi:MAG: NFACT family protein [Chloroflexia bacterium]